MKTENEIKELEQKRREYRNYLNKHKANVMTAYARFKELINSKNINIALSRQELEFLKNECLCHDDSKFSEVEFEPYRKHFFPCSFEEDDKQEFIKAKQHHYFSNNHHPQHASRRNGLNKIACIHNILDWIAISYQFDDKVWEYYQVSNFSNILNPLEKEYIESVLEIIKDNAQCFYPDKKEHDEEER